jgi:hypothetical protein
VSRGACAFPRWACCSIAHDASVVRAQGPFHLSVSMDCEFELLPAS